MKLTVFFQLLVFSLFIATSFGHSYMTAPLPASKYDGGCRVGGPPEYPMNCPGPCENQASPFSPDFNTVRATYQRGQQIEVRWAKNNHNFGFVRWTLIKPEWRMDKTAHDSFAFDYTCFKAELVDCQGSFECGSDETGKAFREYLTIPTVYPDGEYILGWAWFGGGEYSYLGDYYSCTRIKIQGGAAQTATYTPTAKQCYSTMSFIGECAVEPCSISRKASTIFPLKFQGGKIPPAIQASAFGTVLSSPTPTPTPTSKLSSPTPTLTPKPSPAPPSSILTATLLNGNLVVRFPRNPAATWYYINQVENPSNFKFVHETECSSSECVATLSGTGVVPKSSQVYKVEYLYSPFVTVQ